jgi:hypothetical protein
MELNRPPKPKPGQVVTEEQIAADGEAFMEFAQMLGVKPPPARVTVVADDDDVASDSSD